MDIKKLQTLVFDALEDVKGQEIQIFDTTEITSLFDRVCVASGTSNRQTKALAASVRDKVKEAGGDIVGMEGEETGEWVLVDLGDMIVHIMQPAIRAYYRLEEIWGGKEVKMGAAKRGAKKVASDDGDKPKRATRAKAPVEVTHDMMAIQVSADDEEKKPARKPRVSKVAAELVGEKPARKPRASAASGAAKVPSGGRVKVAASKTATASAKAAAAKKTTTRRKTAE